MVLVMLLRLPVVVLRSLLLTITADFTSPATSLCLDCLRLTVPRLGPVDELFPAPPLDGATSVATLELLFKSLALALTSDLGKLPVLDSALLKLTLDVGWTEALRFFLRTPESAERPLA